MKTKDLMSMKPTDTVKDKFSGAEFTVSEITMLVSQMIVSRQYKDADAFSDRFETVEQK